jgi:uncharacterized protein (TIRG00374 family)
VTGPNSIARSSLHWVLGIATLSLLALAARNVEWARTWSAIVHANVGLIVVATLANLASILIKAIRWSLFLRAAGVPGVGLAIRATLAGAALNSLLIANGGDVARVAGVARRANVSSAAVLATAAVDRLSDLATYIALFVISAFLLPLPSELAKWRLPAVGLLTAVVLIGAGAIAWPTREPPASRDPRDDREPTLLARLRDYWRRLVATSRTVSTPSRVAAALALALTAWAGQWATFHYAAHAASLASTPATSLLALLVVNASFVVRLTPGNVGVFQLLYALAATSAGLDRDAAVAVAFLITAIQYIPVMIIGLLLAPSLVTRAAQVSARSA